MAQLSRPGEIMDFLPGSVMRNYSVDQSVEPQSRILAYDDVVKNVGMPKHFPLQTVPAG